MPESAYFRRPLVALSLTEPDGGLLHNAAVAFGPDSTVAVRFLHVLTPRPGIVAGEATLEAVRDAMRAAIEQHASQLGRNAIIDVREDARLDGVLRAATEYDSDLIMLGHRQDRSGRRSLARRLALIAPSSVWLVPEGSASTLQRIVVPTDFSSSSADALQVACRIARQQKLTHVTALHARHDASQGRDPEAGGDAGPAQAQDFIQHLALVDNSGVRIDYSIEEGGTATEALLRAADRLEADLIVMSTRGRSVAAAVLLGSVTSEVMAESRLPVLAVKHHGAQLSLRQVLMSAEFWGGGR